MCGRVKGDFHSGQNVARSTFCDRFFLKYKQSSGTAMADCAYFKRKRSQKVDRETFCTEWKSPFINSNPRSFQIARCNRSVQSPVSHISFINIQSLLFVQASGPKRWLTLCSVLPLLNQPLHGPSPGCEVGEGKHLLLHRFIYLMVSNSGFVLNASIFIEELCWHVFRQRQDSLLNATTTPLVKTGSFKLLLL